MQQLVSRSPVPTQKRAASNPRGTRHSIGPVPAERELSWSVRQSMARRDFRVGAGAGATLAAARARVMAADHLNTGKGVGADLRDQLRDERKRRSAAREAAEAADQAIALALRQAEQAEAARPDFGRLWDRYWESSSRTTWPALR